METVIINVNKHNAPKIKLKSFKAKTGKIMEWEVNFTLLKHKKQIPKIDSLSLNKCLKIPTPLITLGAHFRSDKTSSVRNDIIETPFQIDF